MVSRGLLMRSTTAHRCIRKLTTEIDASLPPMGGCPSSVTPSAGMYHNHYPSSYCACSEVMLLGSLLACNPVRSTHVVLSYPAAFRLPAYSFSTVLFFFSTLPLLFIRHYLHPLYVPTSLVSFLKVPFVAFVGRLSLISSRLLCPSNKRAFTNAHVFFPNTKWLNTLPFRLRMTFRILLTISKFLLISSGKTLKTRLFRQS